MSDRADKRHEAQREGIGKAAADLVKAGIYKTHDEAKRRVERAVETGDNKRANNNR
jgi:hypothetical protein